MAGQGFLAPGASVTGAVPLAFVEVIDRNATDTRRPEHQPSGDPVPRWKGALQPLALAGIAGAACAYVALVDPNQSSAYPQCPLRALTGFDCPGCGLTRSVYALMHGDIGRALDHNVLVVLLLPIALLAFGKWTADRMGFRTPRLPRWRPWMSVALGVLVFGFLIVRNLPGAEYLRATAG